METIIFAYKRFFLLDSLFQCLNQYKIKNDFKIKTNKQSTYLNIPNIITINLSNYLNVGNIYENCIPFHLQNKNDEVCFFVKIKHNGENYYIDLQYFIDNNRNEYNKENIIDLQNISEKKIKLQNLSLSLIDEANVYVSTKKKKIVLKNNSVMNYL